jgi:hypothetical protein
MLNRTRAVRAKPALSEIGIGMGWQSSGRCKAETSSASEFNQAADPIHIKTR